MPTFYKKTPDGGEILEHAFQSNAIVFGVVDTIDPYTNVNEFGEVVALVFSKNGNACETDNNILFLYYSSFLSQCAFHTA